MNNCIFRNRMPDNNYHHDDGASIRSRAEHQPDTAPDADYQPRSSGNERGRIRVRRDQRIAVLIDSETLEITVENMFDSHDSEVKYMYYPEWRSIVSDISNQRRIVRMVYYKKQSRRSTTSSKRCGPTSWTARSGSRKSP